MRWPRKKRMFARARTGADGAVVLNLRRGPGAYALLSRADGQLTRAGPCWTPGPGGPSARRWSTANSSATWPAGQTRAHGEHALQPRHLQLRKVAASRRVPHAGAGQGDAKGAPQQAHGRERSVAPEVSKLLQLEAAGPASQQGLQLQPAPNDYICCATGRRSLCAHCREEHRLTKLGKGFFRDKCPVLQRFHGGLPGEDVHHHQAVLRLPPRVLAKVDEVGLQPVVRPLGGRLAQRTRPGRLHLPAHVGLQRLEGHGPLSLQGVSQMAYILPERLLVVRPCRWSSGQAARAERGRGLQAQGLAAGERAGGMTGTRRTLRRSRWRSGQATSGGLARPGGPILQLLDETYFLTLRGTGQHPRTTETPEPRWRCSCASAKGT